MDTVKNFLPGIKVGWLHGPAFAVLTGEWSLRPVGGSIGARGGGKLVENLGIVGFRSSSVLFSFSFFFVYFPAQAFDGLVLLIFIREAKPRRGVQEDGGERGHRMWLKAAEFNRALG